MAAYRIVCERVLNFVRIQNFSTSVKSTQGLVLGAYSDKDSYTLTEEAENFDKENNGILSKNLNIVKPKQGKCRIILRPSSQYEVVALVGLGKSSASFNNEEKIDERKENVRVAAAAGCRVLQELEISKIEVESLNDAEASAEGATLGLWAYQEWKNPEKRKKIPVIKPHKDDDSEFWNNGIIKAGAQNLVRDLAEAPSNFMTPTKFAECAKEHLEHHNVHVKIHDEKWAKSKGMGAFLSVTKGSQEPCKFVEMSYLGEKEKTPPVVLVGKGVTFDSGGISLKPSSKMEDMRADMSGAACVVGILKAIAQLQLSINVIGLTPLCENLPSGTATKPGDIVKAMNGKYIQVDNTDAEGRLILADALCYSSTFNPRLTMDIATLTGAMRVALGGVMTGVFSNNDEFWQKLENAGQITGDRVWRFPLVKEFTKRMTEYTSVDVNNVGKGTGGGACTAAAFLKEFAPKTPWMHLDIAGVMGPSAEMGIPYLTKGFTGRPTRTIVQFLTDLSCSK